MGKVSIREIARRTGYSPATVSNALNGKQTVSSRTAGIVLAEAERLGYRREGKLDHVQFVIARTTGRIVDEQPFNLAVITGVEAEARRHNLTTSLTTLDLSDHKEARKRIAELCSDPTGGVALLATEMTNDDDYALFEDSKSPLVMVDGWSDKLPFDAVTIANESAAYRATAFLAECGHEKIGYLSGDFRIRNYPLREQGYRHVLDDVTIKYDPRFRLLVGTTYETAQADICAWLDTDPELPTAFFADNDVVAVAAIRALTSRGISVPDDVSIMGFDDIDMARATTPALTTVHVPRQGMGELAVRNLLEQAMNPRHVPSVTQVHTMLVERESVRHLM
ncbi:LacI family DNA-binding transcriptional regulator [uncultured Parolsenella sp.]|uniref:LacI family DNA-binding transcriptional regulator n=1 Tax=uncultured Parolsenella sp. TaxID=2083008 RepID=UPI0025EB8D5B|nr:LacI family DNA-binding transcriptional regulator [uncultured Parolsenella sp.]